MVHRRSRGDAEGPLSANDRGAADPVPPPETLAPWGAVRLGHPQPSRHLTGLATLVMAVTGYTDGASLMCEAPRELREIVGTDGPSIASWFRRCEGEIGTARPAARALSTSLYNQGPDHLDGVVTYEHIAVEHLQRLDRSGGALPGLRMVYPEPTLIANHPALPFRASPEEMAATSRWIAFLRSPEAQVKAIELGLRPGVPLAELPVEARGGSPLSNLRRYGAEPELEVTEVPRPDGVTLEALRRLWVVGVGRD